MAHPGPAVSSVEAHQGGGGAGITVLQGGAPGMGLISLGTRYKLEFFSS